MLKNLTTPEAKCSVKFKGGEKTELHFRSFTLRDLSWLQENFNSKQDQAAIANMRIDAVSKIVWHMLTPESKVKFNHIKFEEFNENTGQVEQVNLQGYERLQYALEKEEDLINLFATYSQMKSLQDFLPTASHSHSKKKL